jgi:beta-lactamase superfamily II metal-dependent hydrolase
MNCEIEFLAVGAGCKPGDAIIVRYGEPNAYQLMVIEGGNAEAGKTLVAHLKKHFGDDVWLAHVVLTHSDADHASGLREVLREIPIQNLWIHIPWHLAEESRHLFNDKRWTKDGLAAAIKQEYDIISEIVDLAVAAGCKIHYPFQGTNIGPFRVLSPSRTAYVHLLPQFDKTPDPDQALLESASMWLGKAPTFVAGLLEKVVAKAQTWIEEKWNFERLKDGGVTSASNESSVVLYGDFGENRRALLTGDAGINGLTWAANFADFCGFPLQQFSFVQIPHHGSRRNVGPTILNRLLGGIQPEGSDTRFTAFVSAPADDDTHPRKMVLNAFLRRGGKVIATQGTSKIHYGGFPKRDGYDPVTPMSFFPKVEAYD